MEPERHTPWRDAERWTGLALCGAVLAAAVIELLIRNAPGRIPAFAPGWAPLAAAALGAAGIAGSPARAQWPRVQRALHWIAILLMLWSANGLPLDLLRLTGLIPLPVNWPGLVTKSVALAALIVLAHLALARPAPASSAPARWYGYAAFVLALPYPVLRTWWALGGTPGLERPGAAGQGWAPCLLAIPWLMAAVLSLLLVPTWRSIPRRLLLTAGWTATAIVGMIGPAACWVLLRALVSPDTASPRPAQPIAIATWVFGLFYGSWLLWAIAAGAATRSYQLRSAPQA